MKSFRIVMMITLIQYVFSVKYNPEKSLFDQLQNDLEDKKVINLKNVHTNLLICNESSTQSLSMNGIQIDQNQIVLQPNTLLQIGGMRMTADQLSNYMSYYQSIKTKCGSNFDKCRAQPQTNINEGQMRFQQKNNPNINKQKSKTDTLNKDDINSVSDTGDSSDKISIEGVSEDQLNEQVEQLLD